MWDCLNAGFTTIAAPTSSRVVPSGTKSGAEGLQGANVVLNGCSVGKLTQQFRQGCRASRSTASTVHAAVLGAQVRVSNELASEAAPSAPAPPSSSISTGTEASVPGIIPLLATGVLGRDVVDAVDDAGDAGARRIGEKGGLEPPGIDANDSMSLSAETAIQEIGADDA
ncbi:unnamed protein product [Phytophthora fragariaefolia]|uniref:Unnamed protein product n=1 Tax=Phytophthora fragariaefolia TaxID=1490495 RepID=A0A9W7CPT1_9STRA|nr:unnamed protein product [Phytophthora fragariaefolia]